MTRVKIFGRRQVFLLAASFVLSTRAATLGQAETSHVAAHPVVYTNAEYGFRLDLPASWAGYTVVRGQWTGTDLPEDAAQAPAPDGKTEYGPLLLIRHPLWTAAHPREDLPIMILPLALWPRVEQERVAFGGAPMPPAELGRNHRFVFALPARYDFDYLPGYKEVEQIVSSKPLHGVDRTSPHQPKTP